MKITSNYKRVANKHGLRSDFPHFIRFLKAKAKQFSALRVIKFGEPIKLEKYKLCPSLNEVVNGKNNSRTETETENFRSLVMNG